MKYRVIITKLLRYTIQRPVFNTEEEAKAWIEKNQTLIFRNETAFVATELE